MHPERPSLRRVAGVRARERVIDHAGSAEPRTPLARGREKSRKGDGAGTGSDDGRENRHDSKRDRPNGRGRMAKRNAG